MDGNVFNIQRFSIFDGPGIRTNVFFKGCNLRCIWCHNPESQLPGKQLMFYSEKCTGCGKCREICGNTFTDACTACGRCTEVCIHGARKISGYRITADEVTAKVLRDREYYLTSGGGVTLSGGEPLLQADFASEILRQCKENGIHTAIETAGNVGFSEIEKVLPYTDLFLYDIKCIDPLLHKELTGVPNGLILENAGRLKETGIEILFRMPVVPGLNSKEVPSVKKFTGDFPLELLAYHSTGCGKYTALNRKCGTESIVPPEKTEMQKLADDVGAIYKPTGV